MIAECDSFGAMTHPKKSWLSATAQPGLMVSLLVVGLSMGACSKKDDENRPAAIPPMAASGVPPQPSPPAQPIPPPPSPPMPAAPMAAPPAMPGAAADEPAPPQGPIDPKASITGTVILPAARRADVAPSDVIFLVARRIADNPSARGTLVAVKKLSAASFPLPFTLSARDMMVPTGAFDGDVSISVRVDKDGDPMTRRKGDVFGGLPKVRVGTHGVKLALDQIQAEDESLLGSGPQSPHGAMPGLPPGHP
jgi:hypothetical protein